MLPFINLFGARIPTYGTCFVIGMTLAVIAAWAFSKQRKEVFGFDVVYSAVFAIIGALVGAKLLFIIVNLPNVIGNNPKIILLYILGGGFVFYGGLLGGIVGLIIYLKKFKLDILTFFDLFATVIPLGHAFGRIGCFLAGCCYGMEYNGPFHIVYHTNIGNTPLGVPLFPVQLAEALALLCLFVVLAVLYGKKPPKGVITAVYGISYSVIRFLLEFLRGDIERGFAFGMSTSQIISLVFAVVIICVLLRRNRTLGKE